MSLKTSDALARLVVAHRSGDAAPQLTIDVARELEAFIRHESSTHERWLDSHHIDGVIFDPARTRTSGLHIELYGEARFTPRGRAPIRASIELFSDNTPLDVEVLFGNDEDPWRAELLGLDPDHPEARHKTFSIPRLRIHRRFDDPSKRSARDALRDQRAMRLIQSIEQGYRPSQISEWFASENIGVLDLILVLRTATGCSLKDAKMLGDVWSSGKVNDPEEFDKRIWALFKARPLS